MTGAVAALAAAPPVSRTGVAQFFSVASTAAVALPYLAFVAIQSHGAAAFSPIAEESPSAIWSDVFGPTQQYLVTALLLLGPIMAGSDLVRWRLAVPLLVLLGLLLDPALAHLLSRYVTSPTVYWRVTWSLPLLINLGAALVGRGRDAGCPAPPAQIRTSGITAYGSCLRS